MERKRLLCSAMLLLSIGNAYAGLSTVVEHRSQSSNNARKVAGEFGYTHLHDFDEWYARHATTLEYQRQFRSKKFARALFGCFADDCGLVRIQGSAVENREANALLADYFYLPTDFDSTIRVRPVISDIIFDYDFYVGFNWKCVKNAYFRAYAPLVRSKWMLNMEECVANAGTNDYPAGYFTPCPTPNANLLHSFCEYMSGAHPAVQCATIMNDANIDGVPNPLAVGDELASTTFNGLKYLKAGCGCSREATTIADLRMELGWDFWAYDCYHLGMNVQAAFPTGTRPNAQYLFNPVVGNGKHWEFGGGVTGHYIFWECGDFEKSFGINLDANITYMFQNHEQRTFDLAGKCLSRYMLAAREGRAVAVVGALAGFDAQADEFITPCGQFKYEYTPVANLTTLDIKVKNALQADVALWLNYTNRNLSVDLGYNLWARSHDEIEVRGSCKGCPSLCDDCNQDVWVLKGTAQEFGFVSRPRVTECNPNLAVPLSQSQSGATITGGAALDNALPAFGNLEGDELNREQLFAAPTATVAVETSVNPVYINCENIDLCARPIGISNKVWTNIQWTWDLDRDCNPMRCKPFLGLGAEVEFGVVRSPDDCACSSSSSCGCSSSSSSCPTICADSSSCVSCDSDNFPKVAASQWGIWLKGGMNFE